MKISRLELTRYGAFDDRSVTLGPGLTVVYGPNESGKSTLGHALGDFLWGLRSHSHPYKFRFPSNRLAVTATVQDAAGSRSSETIVLTSKGWQNTAKAAVVPWWQDGPVTSRDAWQASLGMDRDHFRAGGREVLTSGGDLAPLLFQARTGVDLESAREAMKAAADDLYRRHGGAKKTKVRSQARAVDEARRGVEDATSSGAKVVRLRDEVHNLEREALQSRERHTEAKAVLAKAEEALRAWESGNELRRVREELADLVAAGRVLNDDDVAAYDAASSGINSLTRDLAGLTERIERLTSELDQMPVDDDALAHAEAVDALRDRQVLVSETQKQIPKTEGELAGLLTDLRDAITQLDPDLPVLADASAPPHDLLAAARSLMVAADVTDRINREAERLAKTEERLTGAHRELEQAKARRVNRDVPDLDAASPEHLAAARARRDRAWTSVREPFRAGRLPADDERDRLVLAVDQAIATADTLADDMADRAEAAGRLFEVDADVETRTKHVASVQHDLEQALGEWRELLRDAGIPDVLDREAWIRRTGILADLSTSVARFDTTVSQLDQQRQRVASFDDDVAEVAEELGIEGADTATRWSRVEGLLRTSRENRTAVERRRQDLTEAQDERDGAAEELAAQKAVLDRLSDDDDLADTVERSRRVAGLQSRETELLEQVRAAANPGTDVADLVARVADRTRPELDDDAEAAREAERHASEQRDDATARLAQAAEELAAAERQGNAAELHEKEGELAEQLAADVEEYLQTRFMTAMLEKILAEDRPDEDSALVTHAEGLAKRLTQGRVTGLTVEEDADGRRLRIEADDLDEGTHSELSEGTADQVFLALRLAGIRQLQAKARADGRSTLPVLLDDVLMAHDDARTKAALQVLAKEASDNQILLTTHHRWVLDLADEIGAATATLDSRPVLED